MGQKCYHLSEAHLLKKKYVLFQIIAHVEKYYSYTTVEKNG